MQPESRHSRHIPALDGVRGLAILLVLCAHLTVWGASAPDAVSRNVTLLGFSGVDLFFVLSGFLITRLLWSDLDAARRSGTEGSALRRFWIRRVLRIWPLYLAALVGLFVVLPMIKGGWTEYPMPELWSDRWYYWLHATNVKAALQGTLDLPYNTGHFWSLAVEEQFYLVWPFLLLRVRTLAGLRRLCLFLIGGAWVLRLVFGAAKAGYVLMPPRMDGLAFGALLFALSEGGQLDRWRVPAIWAGIVALAAGAVTMPLREAAWASIVLGIAATIFHTALLARVLTGSQAGLDRPWLRMLGRYSYGIYVIHFPLILVLQPTFARARALPALWGWTLPTAIACFVSGTALALVLAVASYHLFERHFLRLKDRLAPSAARPPLRRLDREPSDSVSVSSEG